MVREHGSAATTCAKTFTASRYRDLSLSVLAKVMKLIVR
jgi:hypothetical protein